MRVFMLLLITLYCVGLTACSQAKPPVADADPGMVRHCTFIVSVTGTSPFGGLLTEYGITQARNNARSMAAKIGATHLVWFSVSSGNAAAAGANAYRCQI